MPRQSPAPRRDPAAAARPRPGARPARAGARRRRRRAPRAPGAGLRRRPDAASTPPTPPGPLAVPGIDPARLRLLGRDLGEPLLCRGDGGRAPRRAPPARRRCSSAAPSSFRLAGLGGDQMAVGGPLRGDTGVAGAAEDDARLAQLRPGPAPRPRRPPRPGGAPLRPRPPSPRPSPSAPASRWRRSGRPRG